MDAPCEIQGSIHVFRLVNNMCPGKWVHIRLASFFDYMIAYHNYLLLLYCSSWINSTDTSAGDTPEMRLAWPME